MTYMYSFNWNNLMKNHILCKNGAGKLGHYYWHFLFGYLFPLVYWLNKDSFGILQKKLA